jgi:hypothetical protein
LYRLDVDPFSPADRLSGSLKAPERPGGRWSRCCTCLGGWKAIAITDGIQPLSQLRSALKAILLTRSRAPVQLYCSNATLTEEEQDLVLGTWYCKLSHRTLISLNPFIRIPVDAHAQTRGVRTRSIPTHLPNQTFAAIRFTDETSSSRSGDPLRSQTPARHRAPLLSQAL